MIQYVCDLCGQKAESTDEINGITDGLTPLMPLAMEVTSIQDAATCPRFSIWFHNQPWDHVCSACMWAMLRKAIEWYAPDTDTASPEADSDVQPVQAEPDVQTADTNEFTCCSCHSTGFRRCKIPGCRVCNNCGYHSTVRGSG